VFLIIFILMNAAISLTCDQLFLRFPCLPHKHLGNWITIANLSKMERMLAQLCLPVLGKYVSWCHIRWTDYKLYMKNPRWCNNHNISHYFQPKPTRTLRTNLSDGNCFDPRLGSSSGQHFFALWRQSGRNVKLATQLRLRLTLRTSGYINPLL
jgi:hypothetical protein